MLLLTPPTCLQSCLRTCWQGYSFPWPWPPHGGPHLVMWQVFLCYKALSDHPSDPIVILLLLLLLPIRLVLGSSVLEVTSEQWSLHIYSIHLSKFYGYVVRYSVHYYIVTVNSTASCGHLHTLRVHLSCCEILGSQHQLGSETPKLTRNVSLLTCWWDYFCQGVLILLACLCCLSSWSALPLCVKEKTTQIHFHRSMFINIQALWATSV